MTEHHDIKDESIRQQIIQAAQHLFQVHGFQKVTMDDVAREIGKGRSSLYYYYRSKEEILDAAIDVEMKEILAEIKQVVDQAEGLEQKMSVYCLTRLKITQKRRALYNMLESGLNGDEMSDYRKIKNTKHLRFRQLEISLVRQILHVGIEKGTLRILDPAEQDTLIFVILSSIQGFKKEMVLKKSLHSIEPAIKLLIDLVISGFKK